MDLELKKLHQQWGAVQPLPKVNHETLWQWISFRFSHYSNQFEGNTLMYNETQLLLLHGRAEGARTLREYEEMKAHNEAFKHIRRLAKETQIITEADIRNLNKTCLKEPFYKKAQTSTGESTTKKIIPGQYKTTANHVVTQTGNIFYFASPTETPIKMQELAQWLQNWLQKNKEEQYKTLISFLADLHQKFICIHPFDDGNGRVVRLLLAYVLMRLNFLPMVLNKRPEYIKAIQAADAGNMSHLETLFLNNIITMLKHGVASKSNQVDLNQDIETT